MHVFFVALPLILNIGCRQRLDRANPASEPLNTQMQILEPESQSFFLFVSNYEFDDEDRYKENPIQNAEIKFVSTGKSDPLLQIKEAVSENSSTEILRKLGARFAYIEKAGQLTDFDSREFLTDCYSYYLDSSGVYIIYAPDSAFLHHLLLSIPSVTILASGSICASSEGKINYIDNNNYYGSSIPSNFNLYLYLNDNGYELAENPSLELTGLGSFLKGLFGKKEVPSGSTKIWKESFDSRLPAARSIEDNDFLQSQFKKHGFHEEIRSNSSGSILKTQPSDYKIKLKGDLDGAGVYTPSAIPSGFGTGNLAEFMKTVRETEYGKKLGKGGFGDVHEITVGSNKYAAKELRFSREMFRTRSDYESAVFREIEGSELSNGNAVGVGFYGAYKKPDGLYVLIYDLQKSDLKKQLTDRYKSGKQFQSKTFWEDADRLGTGLAWYHSKGYVYRDWKGENLFIDPTGSLRIGDYGGLRPMHQQLFRSYSGSYTPLFRSPWRELESSISEQKANLRKLSESPTSSSNRSKIKMIQNDLENLLRERDALLAGTSSRSLMIKDDIFSYTAALLEQRTGRSFASFRDSEYGLDRTFYLGDEWAKHLAKRLKNLGLQDDEIRFFVRGLDNSPGSTRGFSDMTHLLENLPKR